jgi:hypothetical protein
LTQGGEIAHRINPEEICWQTGGVIPEELL